MFTKKYQPQTSTPQNVKIPISCGVREAFTDISLINSSNIIKEELDIIDDHYIEEKSNPMPHNICEVLVNGQATNTVLNYDFIQEQPCLEYNEDDQEDEKDPLFIGQIEDEEKHNFNEPSNSFTTRQQVTSENVCLEKGNKQEEEDEIDEEEDEEYGEVSDTTENDEIPLSQLQLNKLENLTIQLQHVVPPQHLIKQRTISRCTPRSKMIEFEKYCKMKKGAFSTVEDSIIIKNWKMFCQVHEWDEDVVEPFLRTKYGGKFYIKNKEQRQNFVRFLANGLPWRSLFSVFSRFRSLFHKRKNGTYSSIEDEQILAFIDGNKKMDKELKWVQLGEKMCRDPKSIAKRYVRLKKMANKKATKIHCSSSSSFHSRKDKKLSKSSIIITKNAPNLKKFKENTVEKFVTWSPQLVTIFIDNLLKVSAVEDLRKLKNVEIHNEVWSELEKLMKIDKKVLENFWNLRLHMQLFSSTPIYLDDLKIALIQFFHQSDFNNFGDIKWKRVCEHFDGITVHFLKKLWNYLLGYAQTKITSPDYNDLVNYLYLMHISEIRKNTTEAFLPLLYYKKNNLILLDKGTEKEIPGLISADPLNNDDDAQAVCNTEIDDNAERDYNYFPNSFESRNKSRNNKIRTSVDWDLNLVQTFIDHLLQYTSSNLNTLKNKTVPEDVWLKIQCSMRISKLALQEFWYLRLHLQLFSPTPVHLSQIQINLIELLHDLNIKNINDIVWDEICLKFEGSTALFLSKLFDSLIQQALTKINSDNFQELLNYLYTKYVIELEDNITDVVLPALHCKNGKIVSVMIGAEKIDGNTTHDPFINTVLEE
ncbi:uncharacterized protein LOC106659515 [Trichogramma pretiosum]|uniref:uncharacterized protein LOC106659515 n=1 Tax=Trichogramma pretiosum TaxID=7493 RepID=UPI0006C96D7B|nr:uncharacterized protein LOC106659515 [Trichogramma pretiosum]XP_014237589.1 uncharacterized protein LOC106659515 [Trichogramma pretiosum]